jgi:hypothetical protein
MKRTKCRKEEEALSENSIRKYLRIITNLQYFIEMNRQLLESRTDAAELVV